MRTSLDYHVFATNVPIRHRGEVAVLYRAAPHFQVKALQQHGLKVLSFMVELGGRRWFIVGFYLPPGDVVTIKCMITAISQCPRGAALLVAREFNADLMAPEGSNRGEDNASSVATTGMEDMSAQFHPL